MRGKAKKGLAVVAAVIMTTIGAIGFTAPSASAASGTISGTITCFWGDNVEVGVWINAANGTDGWASWWSNGDGSISYSYTLSQSSTYQVRAGCGGTPAKWGQEFVSYSAGSTWFNGQSYDWICTYQTSLGYICYPS